MTYVIEVRDKAVSNGPPVHAAAPICSITDYRYAIIRPALGFDRKSGDFRATVATIAAGVHLTPGGARQFERKTIRKWIREHDEKGRLATRRAKRSDIGRRRVFFSRRIDAAISLPPGRMEELRDEVIRTIAGHHREAGMGWRHSAKAGQQRLADLIAAVGIKMPGRLLRLSKEFVLAATAPARVLHDKENDARRFADIHLPRTVRSRDGLVPSQVVIGDVHPVDVLVACSDGVARTPKMVAFQCAATNRIFWRAFLLREGEGIRQEHVIRTFVDMVADPTWGMPGLIHIDNGSEFAAFSLIDDGLRLVNYDRAFHLSHKGENPELDKLLRTMRRRSLLVHSRPYNAPAKPIEGVFGALEKLTPALPGFIGGNRMKSKTKNLGQAPSVMQGGEETFNAAFAVIMEDHETTEQSGHLQNRSPRQAYNEFVTKGWEPVTMTRAQLACVFAKTETRIVSQGGFTIDRRKYQAAIDATGGDPLALHSARKVTVRIPIVDASGPVHVFDQAGGFICMAEPAQVYGYLDPEGARQQAKRQKAVLKALRDYAAPLPSVDPLDVMAKAAAEAPAALIPKPGARLSLSPEMEKAASAAKKLKRPGKRTREQQAADEFAATGKLLAELNRGRNAA